jgi:hypothetical protein
MLHFGAVDWEAVVSVNSKQVATHRGGYDGFSADITSALTASGPQEIVVSVWDPTDTGAQPRGKQVSKPNGIWYSSVTGIWQTVWRARARRRDRRIEDRADVDAGVAHHAGGPGATPTGGTPSRSTTAASGRPQTRRRR